MAETIYQLVMSAGPNPGKIFPLEKNEIFLGRDLTNDIVVNDAEISRRHARLVRQDSGYVIEDLGSTNGTHVNGQRISTPYALRGGETITLGEHVSLAYEAKSYDPDATIAASQATEAANFPPPIQPAVPPPSPPPPPSSAAPMPPPPSYSGQVPSGPISVEPAAPPRKRGVNIWLIVIAVVLLLCICACAAIIWYVDSQNLYCQIAPTLFNCPP